MVVKCFSVCKVITVAKKDCCSAATVVSVVTKAEMGMSVRHSPLFLVFFKHQPRMSETTWCSGRKAVHVSEFSLDNCSLEDGCGICVCRWLKQRLCWSGRRV